MYAFNLSLIAAVLSCIVMIGATPIGNNAPAEAISRRASITCQALPEVCDLCEKNPLEIVCGAICAIYPLPICNSLNATGTS